MVPRGDGPQQPDERDRLEQGSGGALSGAGPQQSADGDHRRWRHGAVRARGCGDHRHPGRAVDPTAERDPGALDGRWAGYAAGLERRAAPRRAEPGDRRDADLPSDLVDLRTWLNVSEQATGKAVHGWSKRRGDGGRGEPDV